MTSDLAAPPVQAGSARPVSRRRRRGTVTVAVALAALLAYGTADALDEVPGILTLTPAPAQPLPQPTLVAAPAPAPGVAQLDPAAPVPQHVAALVDALAADPRMTSGVPGQPRPGTPGADAPQQNDAEPVDPTVGVAAQHSVPAGTPPAVLVLDAATGQVLGAAGEATPRIPASAQKVFTAAAVLTTRDPAATLDTRALLGEDGTLTLVGGGDVLLGADAGNPAAVDGRAGIGDLARAAAAALTARGITQVHLRLDDSLLPPPTPAPGLTPADTRWVMPVQPLALHTGLVDGARAGDPALQAAAHFAAHLTAAGITVAGGPERAAAPEGAQEVARVASAPLADVVRFAIKESDNSVTELLGRLVAIDRGVTPDLAGATAAVTAVVAELGVDTAGVALADCSGLSPYNRTTVTALAQTMRLAAAPGHDGLVALAADLPVAGLDGTLHNRLDGPAAGVARGKTGTLGAVTSLTGQVLDADGRVLVYAVIADGLPRGGVLGARAAIDSFVTALAGCGC